jgi:hypothetical protein
MLLCLFFVLFFLLAVFAAVIGGGRRLCGGGRGRALSSLLCCFCPGGRFFHVSGVLSEGSRSVQDGDGQLVPLCGKSADGHRRNPEKLVWR